MLGTPSDPAVNDDYIRCMKREDELLTELNRYYENLLEIMVLVELSFKRTQELEHRIDLIEILNESVNDHVNNRIEQFKDRIRDALSSLPVERKIIFLRPGHAQLLTRYNARSAILSTDHIMAEMDEEMRHYINSHIEWPVDELLVYLKRELDGEDNEALQAWRVQISP
jgi:hypothetical protein